MLTQKQTKRAAALIAEHWEAGSQMDARPNLFVRQRVPTATPFRLIWML